LRGAGWKKINPYLILDSRSEKVRGDGAVCSQAVLIAIGIDCEGRRNARRDITCMAG
jgi:transposase-like protein